MHDLEDADSGAAGKQDRGESKLEVGNDEPDDRDPEPGRGIRVSNRLAIAEEVGAEFCVRRLREYRAGEWPPAPKPHRILVVTGVAMRGIWVRISHPAYTVQTDQGSGFLTPPGDDRRATVFLKGDSSMGRGRDVKLTKALFRQVKNHEPALNPLRETR